MGQDCVAIYDGVEVPDYIAEALLYVHDYYDGVGLVEPFPGELCVDGCSAGQRKGRDA